jgi:hypothetical protein
VLFRSRSDGNRAHVYRGIRLSEKAQKYVDSIQTFDEGVF